MEQTNIYYPLLNDENFNSKINDNYEFNQYKNDDIKISTQQEFSSISEQQCSTKYFNHRSITKLVSTYISPNTPYNNLLVYHGVGVGKTCSSIIIGSKFEEYCNKMNKKVYIIVPPNIINQFAKSIFDPDKISNDNSSLQCTGNKYSELYNNFIKTEQKDPKSIKTLKLFIKQYTHYELCTQTEFINKFNIDNKIKQNDYTQIEMNIKQLLNSIIIIDEVHNLRDENYKSSNDDLKEKDDDVINNDKDSGKKLKKLLQLYLSKNNETLNKVNQNVTNNYDKFFELKTKIIESNDKYLEGNNGLIKLVLLSATPIFNSYQEVIDLFNLFILNDNYNNIHDKLLKEEELNNGDIFKNKTKSYVSFFKGDNPFTFPLALYPNQDLNNLDNYNFNSISDKLLFNYNNSVDKEWNEGIFISRCNDYQSNLVKDNQSNIKIQEKFLNFAFEISGKKDTYNKYKKEYEKQVIEKIDFLSEENIEQYSCKMNSILKIIKQTTGKIFIYSQYKEYGIYPISYCLEKLGYVEYNENKIDIKDDYKRFIQFSSDNNTNMQYLIDIFNNKDNKYGKNIKFIIGTDVLKEGISLFHIRQIHLFDLWWNLSKLEQIIGRAFRNCSHIDLPFEERNVSIFNHVSLYEDDKIENNKLISNKNANINAIDKLTSKYNNNKIIINLMKDNAIDCAINKYNNNLNNLKDIKFKIKDSFNNEIDNISLNITDNIECNSEESNYENNFNFNTFNYIGFSNNYRFLLFYIKNIFIEKDIIFFKIEDLFNHLNDYNIKFKEEEIFNLLNLIINNKEFVYDKFNRKGYIIKKNNYYIFSSIEIVDENLDKIITILPNRSQIKTINNYSLFNHAINNIQNDNQSLKKQITYFTLINMLNIFEFSTDFFKKNIKYDSTIWSETNLIDLNEKKIKDYYINLIENNNLFNFDISRFDDYQEYFINNKLIREFMKHELFQYIFYSKLYFIDYNFSNVTINSTKLDIQIKNKIKELIITSNYIPNLAHIFNGNSSIKDIIINSFNNNNFKHINLYIIVLKYLVQKLKHNYDKQSQFTDTKSFILNILNKKIIEYGYLNLLKLKKDITWDTDNIDTDFTLNDIVLLNKFKELILMAPKKEKDSIGFILFDFPSIKSTDSKGNNPDGLDKKIPCILNKKDNISKDCILNIYLYYKKEETEINKWKLYSNACYQSSLFKFNYTCDNIFNICKTENDMLNLLELIQNEPQSDYEENKYEMLYKHIENSEIKQDFDDFILISRLYKILWNYSDKEQISLDIVKESKINALKQLVEINKEYKSNKDEELKFLSYSKIQSSTNTDVKKNIFYPIRFETKYNINTAQDKKKDIFKINTIIKNIEECNNIVNLNKNLENLLKLTESINNIKNYDEWKNHMENIIYNENDTDYSMIDTSYEYINFYINNENKIKYKFDNSKNITILDRLLEELDSVCYGNRIWTFNLVESSQINNVTIDKSNRRKIGNTYLLLPEYNMKSKKIEYIMFNNDELH